MGVNRPADSRVRRALPLLFALAALAVPATAGAQGSYVSEPVEPGVFNGDLSELPGDRQVPTAHPEGRLPDGLTTAPDPTQLEDDSGSAGSPGDRAPASLTGPLAGFDGIRMVAGAPPDPTGEIGPGHFVSAMNTQFRIFDRAGTPLTAALNINTLFSSLGPADMCRTRNDGDPIVMYDQVHDRWIIAQFAVPNPPWAMCIAVSQTSDPVAGGWFAYQYNMSDFPDYEKFGIWHDGLYMSTFEGANNGVFIFEYENMLAGTPGAFFKALVPSSAQGRGSRLLPADLDGTTLPPASEGNIFFQTIDADVTPGVGDVDRIEAFEVKRGAPLAHRPSPRCRSCRRRRSTTDVLRHDRPAAPRLNPTAR